MAITITTLARHRRRFGHPTVGKADDAAEHVELLVAGEHVDPDAHRGGGGEPGERHHQREVERRQPPTRLVRDGNEVDGLRDHRRAQGPHTGRWHLETRGGELVEHLRPYRRRGLRHERAGDPIEHRGTELSGTRAGEHLDPCRRRVTQRGAEGHDARREVRRDHEPAVHVEVPDVVGQSGPAAVSHPPHRLLRARLRRDRLLHHLVADLELLPERARPAVEVHDPDGQVLETVRRLEERVQVAEAHDERERAAERDEAPCEPVPKK